jgi:hypothetical protein
VGGKTRLGLEGYGVRPAGIFINKTTAARPVTRFGMEGYGVRRAGSFANKTPAPIIATQHFNNPFVCHVGVMIGR